MGMFSLVRMFQNLNHYTQSIVSSNKSNLTLQAHKLLRPLLPNAHNLRTRDHL